MDPGHFQLKLSQKQKLTNKALSISFIHHNIKKP